MTLPTDMTVFKNIYFIEREEEEENLKFEESENQVRVKRPDYTFKNGAIYKGLWLGNFRDCYGEMIWPDGATYYGQWRMGKANGKGRFIHTDGDVYDGYWLDNKAHGYGIYRSKRDGSYYEGQWENDL